MAAGDDWVAQLAGPCSVTEVFRRLHEGVERDVLARNELLKNEGSRQRFICEPQAPPGTFRVLHDSRRGARVVVVFECDRQEILVRRPANGDGVVFRVRPVLSLDGACRLLVDGQELEEWHVRKKALESAFFGEAQV